MIHDGAFYSKLRFLIALILIHFLYYGLSYPLLMGYHDHLMQKVYIFDPQL